MARRADCRKCRYFIPAEKMDDELMERALVWIEKWRPGSRLLGWCRAYDRPVTYYTGSCYRYKPKQPEKPTARSILDYMGKR